MLMFPPPKLDSSGSPSSALAALFCWTKLVAVCAASEVESM